MDDLSFPVADAIKAAGSNPLALAAFAVLVAAMLVVALKVRRNKNLLQNLEKLPDKDRLEALKVEMGSVKIKGNLTPEQWLRHNSRQYILGALVVVCLTVVVLVAIVLSFQREPAAPSGIHIGLHDMPPPQAEESSSAASALRDAPGASAVQTTSSAAGLPMAKPTPAPTQTEARAMRGGTDAVAHSIAQAQNGVQTALRVNASLGPQQMAEQNIPEQRVVTYQSTLDKGVSRITYSAPYLDALASGGPIEGFNILGVPFRWRFPELSITVQNNTRGVMVLSEARIEVLEAKPLKDVVLVLEDLSVDRLVFRNEGWGDVIGPRVEFSISDTQGAGDVGLFAPKPMSVDLPSFADRGEIPLADSLPDRLRNHSVVQAQGTIEYGPAEARKTIGFKTRVSLQVRAAVGIPPSYTYDVLLNADKGRVTKQVTLAQEIKAGESDHFVLRVASDRTASYRLRISFVTADGAVIRGSDVAMDIFAPRTMGRLVPAKGG